MKLTNSTTHYGVVSKCLHWSIAAIILALVWLGWYMVGLTYFDKWYNQSLSLHKSFGMLVVALALSYYAWKIVSPSPEPAGTLPQWQQTIARLMHVALMAFMVAIPVTGYLISTSAGQPVPFFGLFDIPPPPMDTKSIRDFAISAHYYLAYGIVALVAGHAGAAIKHELVDKDGTLARMLWR